MDNEWDILTAIVTAGNQRDQNALCKILVDTSIDFSNKPRCVHAAISSIELTRESVSDHKESLLVFVDRIIDTKMDLRTGFRMEVLRGLLLPDSLAEDCLAAKFNDAQSQ